MPTLEDIEAGAWIFLTSTTGLFMVVFTLSLIKYLLTRGY